MRGGGICQPIPEILQYQANPRQRWNKPLANRHFPITVSDITLIIKNVMLSLYRPLGLQEVEASRIHRQSAMLSAPRTGRLYPTQNIPGIFC
jgi:hypothetical protein